MKGAVAFAVAARGSKLEVVVGLSQWLANPAHPALLTRQHWLVDEMFSMLPGIAHVVVNPGYFADNYLGFDLLRFAAHLGIYPNPYGMSRNAPPHPRLSADSVAQDFQVQAEASAAWR